MRQVPFVRLRDFSARRCFCDIHVDSEPEVLMRANTMLWHGGGRTSFMVQIGEAVSQAKSEFHHQTR
jgi:hypothetical protein